MKFTKRNKLVALWLNDRFDTTLGKLSLAEIMGTIIVPAVLGAIITAIVMY